MSAESWLNNAESIIEAATDGPWAAWLDQDGTEHMNGMLMVGNAEAVIPDGEIYIEGVDVNPIAHTYTPEDREFIAYTREAFPQAVAALQAVFDLHCKKKTERGLDIECAADGCDNFWPCPTVQTITEKLGGNMGLIERAKAEAERRFPDGAGSYPTNVIPEYQREAFLGCAEWAVEQEPTSDELDAAYDAFMAHGSAKSFLAHPSRMFICNACGAELADWLALHRHQANEAFKAAREARKA